MQNLSIYTITNYYRLSKNGKLKYPGGWTASKIWLVMPNLNINITREQTHWTKYRM